VRSRIIVPAHLEQGLHHVTRIHPIGEPTAFACLRPQEFGIIFHGHVRGGFAAAIAPLAYDVRPTRTLSVPLPPFQGRSVKSFENGDSGLLCGRGRLGWPASRESPKLRG
jgi:hypothetical protein